METALSLSLLPQLRLKSFVDNIGSFQWDNPDRAETLIKNLCGPLTHEADLLILAVRAGIPGNLQLARNSGFDLSPESSVVSAAKVLSDDHAIPSADARWAAETIAVGMGFIPLSAEAKAAAPPPLPTAPFPTSTPQRHAAPKGYSYQQQQPQQPQTANAATIIAPPPAYAPPPAVEAPSTGAWPPAPEGGVAQPFNNSGQKEGVPAEIEAFRWNWGAFALPSFWCMNHGLVPLGLILLIGGFIPGVSLLVFGFAIYLGVVGHKLAWKNRRFEGGIDQFIAVQRAWLKWAVAAILIAPVMIAFLAAMLFPVFAKAREKAREQAGQYNSISLPQGAPGAPRMPPGFPRQPFGNPPSH